MSAGIKFIRVHGRVIPVRERAEKLQPVVRSRPAAKSKSLTVGSGRVHESMGFKVLGYTAAIGAGLVGAASLVGGVKQFAALSVVEHALEFGSMVVGAAAFKGRERATTRAKKVAKQVAFQEAASWGVFGAALAGTNTGRTRIKSVSLGALNLARKGLKYVR